MPKSRTRTRRLLYVDGPGNVLKTFQAWLDRSEDNSEVSRTFSGDFFDAVREEGAEAYVLSTHPEPGRLESGNITVEHRAVPSRRHGGWRYHAGELRHACSLAAFAVRWRADALIVADQLHWFALWPLRLLGCKVVIVLHCAFWPAGCRRRRLGERLIRKLNGLFWKRSVDATLCVSPEVQRQLLEIAGPVRGPVLQVRAQYERAFFDEINPPEFPVAGPFRVLFAGRLEASKGVFDLLEIATRIQAEEPGAFSFELCGDGSARDALRERIAKRGAATYFHLLGKLDRNGMIAGYGRSHAVIVPTTAGFAEGMNRVTIEGVLAGRPVVTSPASHAGDVLGHAILTVPVGDLAAYCSALRRLRADSLMYRQICRQTKSGIEPFYDRRLGYTAVIRDALCQIFKAEAGSSEENADFARPLF